MKSRGGETEGKPDLPDDSSQIVASTPAEVVGATMSSGAEAGARAAAESNMPWNTAKLVKKRLASTHK